MIPKDIVVLTIYGCPCFAQSRHTTHFSDLISLIITYCKNRQQMAAARIPWVRFLPSMREALGLFPGKLHVCLSYITCVKLA